MRYKIELYKDKNYHEVVNFIKNNSEYSIPPPGFLRDLSLICRDINTYKSVGFVTALVPKYADTAYVSYLITVKNLQANGMRGNRILFLLYNSLEKYLKMLGINHWIGQVDIKNKKSKKLFKRNNVENWGRCDVFRRTII